MPKFYTHLINHIAHTRDEEGEDFPDVAAARSYALQAIRGFLAEEVRHGRLDLRGRVEIADDSHVVVLTIPFDEALALQLDPLR